MSEEAAGHQLPETQPSEAQPPETQPPETQPPEPLNRPPELSNRPRLPDTLNQTLLQEAWRRYDIYSDSATRAQQRFIFLRKTILTLTVVATTLAVCQSQITQVIQTQPNLPWLAPLPGVLRFPVIITPILVSILLAGAVKFDRGINWILLRASAEAIRRETFRYRAKAGIYRDPALRDSNFARELQTISERLMKTNVNKSWMGVNDKPKPRKAKRQPPPAPSAAEIEANYTELTPQQYLDTRLVDQISWYYRKTRQFDQQWQFLQWLIYVLGGVGTFLAAIGVEVWIAVSNALAAALVSFLEFRQLDATLTSYNQTAVNLENVLCWWHALSPADRNLPDNFNKLVENTEAVIQAESTGWVQEMRDALAGLYKEEEDKTAKPILADEEPAPVSAATPRADDNAGEGRTLPSNEPAHPTTDAVQPVPRV